MWRIRTVVEDAPYLFLGAVVAATLFCWGFTVAHLSTRGQRHLVVDTCDVARDQQ